jgi:hypothetical protein
MENPATWGPAERAVDDVLRGQTGWGTEPLVGLSLVRQITDALRSQGLLIDQGQSSLDGEVQDTLNQMRNSFCTARDLLRERRVLTAGDSERLTGEFFQGYQQAEKLLRQ